MKETIITPELLKQEYGITKINRLVNGKVSDKRYQPEIMSRRKLIITYDVYHSDIKTSFPEDTRFLDMLENRRK